MLSESLHPNRLVAGSFASPSRDLLQIGFHLYPLPNNAITGKAGDIGFIQRNGWFGRKYRQTVKLSDFVSHPHITVECGFCHIPEDMNLFVMVSLTDNTSFSLFQVRWFPANIQMMQGNQTVLHIGSRTHFCC